MDTPHRPRGASPAEQARAQRDAFINNLVVGIEYGEIEDLEGDVGAALAHAVAPDGTVEADPGAIAADDKKLAAFSPGQIMDAIRRLAELEYIDLVLSPGRPPVARLWPAPPVGLVAPPDQGEGDTPSASPPKVARAKIAAGRLRPGEIRKPKWVEAPPGDGYTAERREWIAGLAEAPSLRPHGLAFIAVMIVLERHMNTKDRCCKVAAATIAEAIDATRKTVDTKIDAAEAAGILLVARHGRGRGSTRTFRLVPVRLWPDAAWTKPAGRSKSRGE